MRKLLLVVVSLVVSAFISGCGQCAAICHNTAIINAVDASGNPLPVMSITENAGLTPSAGSCGVTEIPSASPPTVTSFCTRFGVDVVATNGKRFSGVIDISDGSNTAPICGSVCKSKSVTVTLQ